MLERLCFRLSLHASLAYLEFQNPTGDGEYESISDADALFLVAGDPSSDDEPMRKGSCFQASVSFILNCHSDHYTSHSNGSWVMSSRPHSSSSRSKRSRFFAHLQKVASCLHATLVSILISHCCSKNLGANRERCQTCCDRDHRSTKRKRYQ